MNAAAPSGITRMADPASNSPRPSFAGLQTVALTALLALAALAGNYFHLSLFFGVGLLLGPIAVYLAVIWLGLAPGLIVALVGGAYTIVLWDHPYALLIFLAEAAFVALHRRYLIAAGQTFPAVAVSASMYWLLIGMPLVLLAYRFGLGMPWGATWLIVAKQALNGILAAALAGMIAVSVAAIRRQRPRIPLRQLLFKLLLIAILLPSLLFAIWENYDLKQKLEADFARRIELSAVLAATDLLSHLDSANIDPVLLEAGIEAQNWRLLDAFGPELDARLSLRQASAAAERTEPDIGTPRGQILATHVPYLSIQLPEVPATSRMTLWRQARYQLVLPLRPSFGDGQFVVAFSAVPLIEEVQQALLHIMTGLLLLTLLGVALADEISRRMIEPLGRLTRLARALPDAIQAGQPLPASAHGLTAEMAELSDAVGRMARSLDKHFRELRAEKDLQARRRAVTALQARTLGRLVQAGDDDNDVADQLCHGVRALLPQTFCALVSADDSGALQLCNLSAVPGHAPAAVARILALPAVVAGYREALASDAPVEIRDETGSAEPDTPGGIEGLALRVPATDAVLLGLVAPGQDGTGRLAAPEHEVLEAAAALAGSVMESNRLRRRHRVLIDALSQARTGVVIAEHNGDDFPITYVNRGFEELTGYRADEAVGRDCRFLQRDDRDQPDGIRMRDALRRGEACRAVLRNYCKDGTRFWNALNLSPTRDAQGRISHYIAVQQDVTEAVENMERLRRSEARLTEAQAIAHVGSWDIDMRTGASNWSDETFRLLGYAPGAVQACVEAFLDVVHPQDRERVETEMAAAAERPDGNYRAEHRARGPDGIPRVLLEQGRILFDADGQPRHFMGTCLDVTEQRRTEETLRRQEERYRLLVDNMEDLIVRADADGHLEFVSPSYCRTFGRSEAELIGNAHMPFIHPDDRAATAEAMKALSVPPHTCSMEQRAHTVHGWRWLQWFDKAIVDENGNIESVIGVGRDVTARKAAEQALRDSEQRFRGLFEHMAEGVAYVDREGNIIDANPAAIEILGLPLEEIRARHVQAKSWAGIREDGTLLPANEHPVIRALQASDPEKRQSVVGYRADADHEVRWLLINAQADLSRGSGSKEEVFVTFSDVTHLKKTENKLKAVIDNSPHGIVEVDPGSRRLLSCNQAMAAMFGYTLEEMIGLELDVLHPRDQFPVLAETLDGVVEDARQSLLDLPVYVPCIRKDGSLFYCKIAPGLMRLGQSATLTAFFTDVTNEFQSRRALERSRETLLQAQALAHVGSWEHDVESDASVWSDETYRIFGASPDGQCKHFDIIRRSFHPEDKERVERAFRDSIGRAEPAEVTHRLVTPDGSVKWVYVRWRHELDANGRPVLTRGFLQDITERKTAELALAEERERLENVIQGTGAGTWEWSPVTDRQIINERWAEMIGYRRDELSPLGWNRWSELVHPEDFKRSAAALPLHLNGQSELYQCEVRLRHKAGHWIWVLTTGRITERNSDGKALMLSGIHQDITPRKLAELELAEREAIIGELLELATRFVAVTDETVEGVTEYAIARMGRFIGADRSYVVRIGHETRTFNNTLEWVADGVAPMIEHTRHLPMARIPQVSERLLSGEAVVIPSVADLGPEWSQEREILDFQQIRALLLAPMTIDGELLAFVGFDIIGGPRAWSNAEVHFLQTFASILSAGEERARSIGELRRSNIRYDELARQSRTLTWEVDAEGRIRYASPVCEPVLGYRRAQLLGSALMRFVDSEAQPDAASIGALIEGRKEIRDAVAPVRRRDGGIAWLSTSAVPLFSASGAFIGYRGVSQDVTERHLAQARIAESEARLRAVVDNAPIGMALFGPDQRLVLANRALSAFLGRTPEEITARGVELVTHPDDIEKDREQFDRLREGKIPSYRITKRYLRADGSVVWGDLRLTLLPSRPGEPPMPLAMVEDITELQAAIERQRAAEQSLSDYTSQLESLIGLVNLSLPYGEQLRVLLRLACVNTGLGAARLSLIGTGGAEVPVLAFDIRDRNAEVPALPPALRSASLSDLGEPIVAPLEGRSGERPAGHDDVCIGLAVDLTRDDGRQEVLLIALWGRRQELDLQSPQRQMLRLIGHRLAAVRHQHQLQRDLVQSRERETIGHLASGIAHDFNNLLGVIDANLYFVDISLAEQDAPDPELQQVMEETRSALGQAKVITSGMLSLSRAGGVPLAQVDLHGTVDELARILLHILPPTITLQTRIPAGATAWTNA
ncbi:MAG: PAS domain S-box protein, partial [Thiohalocapsa sp.]|nr:PAS domain S-box protein [Thiohalocapsa sp.]